MALTPAAAASVTEPADATASAQAGSTEPAPVPAPTSTEAPPAIAQPRGDVRKPTTSLRKIANSRLVWGIASTGAAGVVRSGKVEIKSLAGRPLKAHVLTKQTSKYGYFAVSRLGLPKRFVVQVSGGKVARKDGAKIKVKRSNARLLSVVPKPKPKVRSTKVNVTIGTTVAARVGLVKWRNAAKPRAVKLTKKALGLPAWSKLGTYDRLLSHYVSTHTIHRKAKNGTKLNQLIDRITKSAKKGKFFAKLGQGERAQYRPHRNAAKAKSKAKGKENRPEQRGAIEDVDLALDVVSGALGVSSLLGSNGLSDALDQIEDQLNQIQTTLNQIETQLSNLQDEMQAEFAALSLQVSNDQLATLSTEANQTGAQITEAVDQLEGVVLHAQTVATNSATTCDSICQTLAKLSLGVQVNSLNSTLAGVATLATAAGLQAELLGGSTGQGILPDLWSLILQQRSTQAPATSAADGNTALASTKLLTHEHYDMFEPVASSWYLVQQTLAALTINYQLNQAITLAGSSIEWSLADLAAETQDISDSVMNGYCTGSQPPCPGTFGSYLQVLADAMPAKSVGTSQALDTTTGTIWGNFGTTAWNSVATQPSPTSPDLDLPPTTTATCNDGTQQTVQLDQAFFATVNGTAGNCPWPGAPVGAPAGSSDTANNWQMLATDSGSTGTFNSTLGTLNGTGATGLYSQLYVNNTSQNANPAKGIQGAHFLDFTNPSIFPANSTTDSSITQNWGRLSYASGDWSQFVYNLTVQEQASPVHRPFLAFDLANPLQPDLTGVKDPNYPTDPSSTLYAVPGFYQHLNGFPIYNFSAPLNGKIDAGSTNMLTTEVAGLTAPWWQSAVTYYWDDNNFGPATPGCSSYAHTAPIVVSQGCTSNIIGTRSVTTSDYVWNQPSSLG